MAEILTREQRRERQRQERIRELRAEVGMDEFDKQCLREKWKRLEAPQKISSMDQEI